MVACWSCGAKLPERAVFCAACGTQIRCKACRDILEPNAHACVSCGTLLGQAGGADMPGAGNPASRAVNNLKYDQTDKTVSLRFNFTDESAGSFSEALSLLITSRLGPQPIGHHRMSGHEVRVIEQEPIALPVISRESPQDESGTPAVPEPISERPGSDKQKLRSLFRFEDERLRLINPRLKAHSHREYVRRLTLLFLYAHRLEDREWIPRATLNALANEVGVYNSNYRTWLARSIEVLKDKDMLSLNVPGEETARAVLVEVLNPAMTDKWLPGSGGQARSGKTRAQADKGAEAESKGSRRKGEPHSKTVEQWLAAWRSQGLTVDGHAVLKDRSLADKGILALWAIRKSMGDAGKIVTSLKLAQFLYEAFELKHSDRNLARALLSEAAKGKVLKVGGTKYQIQPPGMQYAEEMCGLTPESVSVASNPNGSTGG